MPDRLELKSEHLLPEMTFAAPAPSPPIVLPVLEKIPDPSHAVAQRGPPRGISPDHVPATTLLSVPMSTMTPSCPRPR